METERIELAGGAWWEVRTVYTVGMARKVEEVMRQYIQVTNLDDFVEGKDTELKWKTDLDAVGILANQRAIVFAATVGWSYGEVTLEVFENEVLQADYLVVSGRCDELFGSIPLPGSDTSG